MFPQSAMNNSAQLETHARELSAAIRSLTAYCQNAQAPLDIASAGPPQLIPPNAPKEAHRARDAALASLTKLQILLAGPTDFLQQMAGQTQVLACIQWLGEFQVPACIPLDGSAVMKDVADLIGVPESQFSRIVRMATTAGFLHEPQPGYIAHSALSAAFVTKPSYLDAAMFLAGTAAPAALQMPAVTKQCSGPSKNDALNVASHSPPFANPGETQLPRLQRQWDAYLRYGAGYICNTATDILTCLEPLRMKNASVVEVGARSTERAIALANEYPTLHFTVQLNSAHASPPIRNGASTLKLDRTRHPRVTIQHRVPGTPQTIQDAAVYIINFPSPTPGISSTSLAAQISSELRAHLNALCLNRSATLVITAPSFPERGSASSEAATLTRIRDLSLLQLANERELEISEAMNLLDGATDGEGRLVLVNKVRSAAKNGAVALEVKYRAYTDR
ncbi:Agnestins biosynthesis cluster transcriptional coactivator AgnL9 [Aspergillus wentii]